MASNQNSRRQAVQEETNLVLLRGQPGRLCTSKTSEADRDKKLDELRKEFGEKFIIFPNPMYGSWETAATAG